VTIFDFDGGRLGWSGQNYQLAKIWRDLETNIFSHSSPPPGSVDPFKKNIFHPVGGGGVMGGTTYYFVTPNLS
jgi:hypothetical protein